MTKLEMEQILDQMVEFAKIRISEKEEFKKSYMYVINECEKYNLKQECRKAIKIAVRDGVYFGLTYETEDSFYIRAFNPNYAEISSVEDGTFVPSIDLNYFSDKLELFIYSTREFL